MAQLFAIKPIKKTCLAMAYVVTITFILVGIHYQTGQQYLGFTRQLTVENLPFIFRQVNAAEQKFVQLHDDTIGNDAGWNPSGRVFEFKIFDPAVKANSVVEVTAKTNLQFRIGLHPTPTNLPPIRSLALNPNTNLIYLANGFSQNVTIINGETNTVVANIPLTDFAFGIGVNSETNKVYVVGQNAVIVINGLTNTVASTIPMDPSGAFPAVAVDSIHNKIYVSRLDIQQVTVIDGLTNTLVANIAVGDRPSPLGFNPLTNRLYVTNEGSNDVNVIDGFTNSLMPINLIICGASNIVESISFMIKCTGAPSEAAELNYSIETP